MKKSIIKMSYQSFHDRPGHSLSANKWAALKLTREHLFEKDVLDLGCNEGFFCHKMEEYGAKSVVGMDYHQAFIDGANKRLSDEQRNKITFKCQSWTSLSEYPENSFDVILLLSAFHYATSPEWFTEGMHNTLLDNVQRILRPNGILVLEAGMVESVENNWLQIKRIRDVVYHPTRPAMFELLNKTFVKVDLVGPSIPQSGDPVHRHVFYCHKTSTLQQTVVLVTGNPGHGKTTLSDFLSYGNDVHKVSMDVVMFNLHKWDEFKELKIPVNQIMAYSRKVDPVIFGPVFVSKVIKPLTHKVIVVDGYTVGIPEIQQQLADVLKKEGYRVWHLHKI